MNASSPHPKSPSGLQGVCATHPFLFCALRQECLKHESALRDAAQALQESNSMRQKLVREAEQLRSQCEQLRNEAVAMSSRLQLAASADGKPPLEAVALRGAVAAAMGGGGCKGGGAGAEAHRDARKTTG